MSRSVSKPSGWPPPTTVTTAAGREIDLVAAAAECCTAYDAEFPDERERYGPAGMDWCRHDNQHLLNWAVLHTLEYVSIDEQVAWLAKVLEAREFPLDRLARDLDIAAEVVAERLAGADAVAAALTGAATMIRSRETFL